MASNSDTHIPSFQRWISPASSLSSSLLSIIVTPSEKFWRRCLPSFVPMLHSIIDNQSCIRNRMSTLSSMPFGIPKDVLTHSLTQSVIVHSCNCDCVLMNLNGDANPTRPKYHYSDKEKHMWEQVMQQQ